MDNQNFVGLEVAEENLVYVSGGTGDAPVYTYAEVKNKIDLLFRDYVFKLRSTHSPLYSGEKFRKAAEEIAGYGQYADLYEKKDIAHLIDIYAGLLDEYMSE